MAPTRRRKAIEQKTRRQNRPGTKIEHHHLLLRLELQSCPTEADKGKIAHMIDQIIQDINMKSLAPAHVYYVKYPHYNEGLTGIVPIETSHIAFHFWTHPDPKLLHTANSNCLLEFDIYTCGSFSQRNVGKVLHHLTHFRPTYADITLLNRSKGLTIERHMHWSKTNSPTSWAEWLNTPAFQ